MTILPRGKKGHLSTVIYVAGKPKWRKLTDEKGAPITRETHSKKQIEAAYMRKWNELKTQAQHKKAGAAFSIPWEEFREKYLEWSRVERMASTVKSDTSTIDMYVGVCNISESTDITLESIKLFIKECSGKVANLTINHRVSTIRTMAKWGQEEGYIDKEINFDVIKSLSFTVKKSEFFQATEIDRLKLDLQNLELRDRLLINIGLMAGMRGSEINNMRVQWVEFDRGVIKITADNTYSPKTYAEREIPLYGDLAALLKEWIELYHLNPGDYIFVHQWGEYKGERMGKDLPYRTLIKFLKKYGHKVRTYYSLRHTFCTHMTGKHDIRSVQSFMGHSKLTTTQIYAHLREGAAEKAAKIAPY